MIREKNNLVTMLWAVFAVFVALGSSWILPLRLLLGSGHSYFTFALIGDEITYAEKLQPLIEGTSAVNTINGIGDTHIVSPLFLECLLRECVTWLHMDVITFFWIWRFVFPVVMLGMLFWLVCALMGRRRDRTWTESLALTALVYGALNLSYEICVDFPTLQGWLMRIPTCVEYPLALMILIGLWRLMVRRTLKSAIFLSGALALAVYLRPFTVVPWVPACALAVGWSWLKKSIPLRPVLLGLATGGFFVAPFVGILQYNKDFTAYQHVMERMFSHYAYSIHYRCYTLLGLGLAITVVGWLFLKGRSRRLIVSLGITLVVLPYYAGIPASLRSELLGFDRFGFFYLIALLATFLLILRRYGSFIRDSAQYSFRRTQMVSVSALLLSSLVGIRNGTYDFQQLHDAPYQHIVRETRYVKGYQYVADHTPSSVWVLLDDEVDWSKFSIADAKNRSPFTFMRWHEDLFSIVARRKRFDHIRLYGSFLTNKELHFTRFFQWMTFGLEPTNRNSSIELYAALLNAYQPGYIFWKHDVSTLRGQGLVLKAASETVYEDEYCEIWKLRYPDALKLFTAKGQENIIDVSKEK